MVQKPPSKPLRFKKVRNESDDKRLLLNTCQLQKNYINTDTHYTV